MKFAARTLLAVIAAMVVAFVLVIAIEWFSSIVHPFPPNGNLPEHVKHYPHWVLAIVVPAWGATIVAATWVASRLGGRLAGIIVAFLLAWGLIFNLTTLPYTPWFKIAMSCAFPIACLLGIRCGRRAPTS
ncbi:MAG TPA: hypothetical protein VKU01_31060 [Bryobacteraceae bacterium]|nr:hypothetical protein [Bryobacteraceae bacterium]